MLLYYEQALTLDQIASMMSVSKAALSRRLKRIRDALLETVDQQARRRLGTSARSLADGLELSEIDLDLRAACVATWNQPRQILSKRRWPRVTGSSSAVCRGGAG